jgi:hypothetical protein
MILVFSRTGQRRYAVAAQREGFPDVVMNPAPGYDPLLPHDMMHLVVEAQLGLTRGIFGQLAAGGDAGSFHLSVGRDQSSRKIGRVRKRVIARGKSLLRQGQDQTTQSERATYLCWTEWLARSSPRERRMTMAQQARQIRNTFTATELRALNERKLNEICKHLDELSSHWGRLEVGQSMAVSWPDLGIVTS